MSHPIIENTFYELFEISAVPLPSNLYCMRKDKVIEIRLRKRNRFERLIRIPKFFWQTFQIGRGIIPLKNRLYVAWVMSILMVKMK